MKTDRSEATKASDAVENLIEAARKATVALEYRHNPDRPRGERDAALADAYYALCAALAAFEKGNPE